MHHLMGPVTTPANGYQFTLMGNAIDGGSTDHRRRWGIAVHNTHYGLVSDNVLYNYAGALVTAEDGSESFNVFDHNFAVRSTGTGGRLGDGNEGQGFWFHGPNNYVRNNVAANFDSDDAEASYGYKYFMRYLGTVNIPTAKGQAMSLYVAKDGNNMPLLEFNNNEVYGASQGGLTYWWLSSQDPVAATNPLESVIKDFKVWHVFNVGIYHYPAARVTFDGLKIFGKDPVNAACCGRGFHGEDYAATNIRIVNSNIEGMSIGFRPSTAGTGLQTVENSYLQNQTDVVMTTLYSANGGGWLPPRKVILSNVRLAGSSAIQMDWNVRGAGQANTSQVDQLLVYQYQNNSADNFRTYYNVQATQPVAGGLAPCSSRRAEIDGIVCSIVAPSITGVTPSTIATAGGVTITIVGANFGIGAMVTIGGVSATSVNRVSATTLTAIAPARPAGSVDVVVSNPDGQNNTLASALTYAPCSYSLSPMSQAFASAGGAGSINVSTVAGCNWTATSGASWITINAGASGSDSGAVGYTVAANTASSARSGSVTAGGQSFTISQSAAIQSCTYALSPASQDFTNLGGSSTITVTTTTGCTWSAASGAGWITINAGMSGSGFGTVTYTVAANTGTTARNGSIAIGGQSFSMSQTGPGPVVTRVVAGDSDGDGRSDMTVFRPSSGAWLRLNSRTGFTSSEANSWGASGDIVVSGDYDGDRKADIAVFRPSTGTWYILQSSTNYTTYVMYQWGLATDTPVPRDYDGDGRTDLAVYRPSTGTWYILQSRTNYTTYVTRQWGLSSDVPVPGDYDGDGAADVAVYRPSSATWYILQSSTNGTTYMVHAWGLATDTPVSDDYDGDGRTDIAVYRPSTGTWYILQSRTNYTTYVMCQWGLSTDVPVPGDYDGDGKADVAVYRPSIGTWLVAQSTTNYATWIEKVLGSSGDVPVLKRP